MGRLRKGQAKSTGVLHIPRHEDLLRDKRCVSMPTVTPVSCSDGHPTTPPPARSRSRLGRAHARRFHQRFPAVDPEEHLVNYYSCALLADILLQGHLYITDNYFAFYSSIFGHKTQVLIPLLDVEKLTKERTAKIIPNAIGVSTGKEKFIFCSLLTRDATYRLMQQVWMKATDPDLGLPDEDDTESDISPALQNGTEDEDEDDSISDRSSSDISIPSKTLEVRPLQRPFDASRQKSEDCMDSALVTQVAACCHLGTAKNCFTKMETAVTVLYRLPKTSLLLVMSTVLLVALFLSASILMYRICTVHRRMAGADSWHRDTIHRINSLFPPKQREGGATVEVSKLIKGIEDKIRQLAQVRESLEELLLTAAHLRTVCRPPSPPSTSRLVSV